MSITAAMSRIRKMNEPYLLLKGGVADFARKTLKRSQKEFTEFEAETGHPHFEVFTLDLPSTFVKEENAFGPSELGPNGWDVIDPSPSYRVVRESLFNLNHSYYDCIARGSSVLDFIRIHFYSGAGGRNDSPREDHPLYPLLEAGDINACWKTLEKWGIIRRGPLLYLRNLSEQVFSDIPNLQTRQWTYGSRSSEDGPFDNVKNMRELGVWGDPQGATYMSTWNINYYAESQPENRAVDLSIDNQELFKRRNVFIDPGSFHHSREFGSSFFVNRGIPSSAISTIAHLPTAEWMAKADIAR